MFRLGLGLCATFVLFSSGCGGALPATVSGTITIAGNPLPEGEHIAGEVMFYPVAGGAAAYGNVSSGGAYEITTGGTKGLEPGEYVVTVRVVQMPPPPPGGYQNAPPQKLVSPPRYQNRDSSDLKFKVTPGKNTIDLNLES